MYKHINFDLKDIGYVIYAIKLIYSLRSVSVDVYIYIRSPFGLNCIQFDFLSNLFAIYQYKRWFNLINQIQNKQNL